jgi:hypothetical protein
MRRPIRVSVVVAWLVLGGLSGLAQAQATRTWVSGVGDDANPCSRTAPCKTFAGAISKTAANGVINALDPAGYGGVTITKAITIEAVGTVASALVSGTNGIIVNAGVNDVVTLRGIQIVGLGTGLNGISFLAGGGLIVEDSTIENFTQSGIRFAPSGTSTLAVRDTMIRGCGTASGGGISIQPGVAGSANASIERVQLLSNRNHGLLAEGLASVNVRASVASLGVGYGFFANNPGGSGPAVQLMLDDVLSTENTATGAYAFGSSAVIRITGSTFSGNLQGLQAASGGQVISFGNNRNRGNITDGAPTSTVVTQ